MHVTFINESHLTWRACAHVRVFCVECVNESCHPFEWDISHKWMSCVTHMNEPWMCVHVRVICVSGHSYGVATIRKLHKITGLFRRISSLLYVIFAEETCNFKEPISRSHPICIWMSHITHMHVVRHTSECVMSHVWGSHVTHINESYRTYEWVMSHIWMRSGCVCMCVRSVWEVTVMNVNESCHAFEWDMSRKWMSCVTHTNGSWMCVHDSKVCLNGHCFVYEWVMSRTCMRCVTRIHESCRTYDETCRT